MPRIDGEKTGRKTTDLTRQISMLGSSCFCDRVCWKSGQIRGTSEAYVNIAQDMPGPPNGTHDEVGIGAPTDVPIFACPSAISLQPGIPHDAENPHATTPIADTEDGDSPCA